MSNPEVIFKLTCDGDTARVTVETVTGAPDAGVMHAAALAVALDGLPMEEAPKVLARLPLQSARFAAC